MWRATVLTLFPGMFPGPLGISLAGRALTSGIWALEVRDIRDARERIGTLAPDTDLALLAEVTGGAWPGRERAAGTDCALNRPQLRRGRDRQARARLRAVQPASSGSGRPSSTWRREAISAGGSRSSGLAQIPLRSNKAPRDFAVVTTARGIARTMPRSVGAAQGRTEGANRARIATRQQPNKV